MKNNLFLKTGAEKATGKTGARVTVGKMSIQPPPPPRLPKNTPRIPV